MHRSNKGILCVLNQAVLFGKQAAADGAYQPLNILGYYAGNEDSGKADKRENNGTDTQQRKY